MWILKSLKGDLDQLFYITPNRPETIVGRSNANLILNGDSSISRKHCILHCEAKETCPKPVTTRTGLWVVDIGSKYGTFVQEMDNSFTKLTIGEPKVLNHGCIIRFGILEHIWSVEYCPIYIATSMLTSEQKLEMRDKVSTIGGSMMPVVDQRCTYLFASKITLTAKVILAMVHGIPIVKPKFLSQLVVSINANEKLPDPEEFKPALEETMVRTSDVKLTPGFKRDILFRGLKFYFLSSEHMECFKDIIEAASGTVSLLDMSDWKALLENNALLLECSRTAYSQLSEMSQGTQPQAVHEIREFLDRNGRRSIPDREVPLAIAYASISLMCNPLRNILSPAPGSALSMPISQSTILEDYTQDREPIIEIEQQTVDGTLSPRSALRHDKPTSSSSQAQSVNVKVFRSSGASTVTRKRLGSLDIFDDNNSKRKMFAVEDEVTTSAVPVNPLFSPPVLKSEEGLNGSAKVKERNTIGRFLSRNQRYSIQEEDEENPFGKRKASEQERPSDSAKKSKIFDLLSNSPESVSPNNSSCKKTTAPITYNETPAPIAFNDKAAVTSIATKEKATSNLDRFLVSRSTIQLVPPATPSTACSAREPSLAPTADADQNGWIDMGKRKNDPTSPGDALCKTIIMMSLVTHPKERSQVPTIDTSNDGLRNYKVFKKQSYPDFNKTIDFQTIPDFQESWSRITR